MKKFWLFVALVFLAGWAWEDWKSGWLAEWRFARTLTAAQKAERVALEQELQKAVPGDLLLTRDGGCAAVVPKPKRICIGACPFWVMESGSEAQPLGWSQASRLYAKVIGPVDAERAQCLNAFFGKLPAEKK